MAVADLWTPGADWATNEKPVAASKLNQQVRDNIRVLELVTGGDTSGQKTHQHLTGTAAARPAAGNAGRYYYATDTNTLSVDNGTTWDTILTNKRKTADEAIANDAVINSPDNKATDLVIAMLANEKWIFEACLFTAGISGADIKIAFDVPAAITALRWSGIGPQVGASDENAVKISVIDTADLGEAAFGTVTGKDLMIRISGTIENGANAGDLQLMFAQNTSNGTGTSIYKNSWLRGYTVA